MLVAVITLGWRQRSETAPFSTRPYTSELGKEYSPSISPDGKTIAYVWDGDQNEPDIYLRPLDNGQPQRLRPVAANRLFPAWSPDGSQIAYLELQDDHVAVCVYSFKTGATQQVTQITRETGSWANDDDPLLGNPGPVWTHDGKALIVADRNRAEATGGLYLVQLNGSRTQLTHTQGEVHDLYPRLSADDRQLAFVRYTSHGQGEIFVMAVAGGTPRQVTFDEQAIQGIVWTADSAGLIFSSDRMGSFQLWTLGLSNPQPQLIATNSSNASDPVISAKGNWLMYADSNKNWNIWRAAFGQQVEKPERFLSSSGRNYDARYSPDGKRIAFVSDRSGNMQIWTADSDGNGPKQLTRFKRGWLGGLNWSADGQWIAFDSRPEGRSAIFVIPSTGGEPKLVEANAFEERMPAWGPDSKSIYFNSVREGGMSIWKRSLSDNSLKRISGNGMFAVMAGAHRIFYSSRTGEIWSAGFNGESPVQLVGVQAQPVMSWFVVGDAVFFSRFNATLHEYELVEFSDGRVTALGELGSQLVKNAPDIALSPDKRHILFAQEDISSSDLKIRTPIQ